MSSQIKLALIDDEQLILEGVKMLLSNEKKNISFALPQIMAPIL